jgi:glycine/sarcosine N-methyltransferase
MDEYKIISEVYDILNPKEEIFSQKPFFEELVNKYSITSCLDAACGTGWHLSMLYDMGLDCGGSDISPEMIRLAKENLSGKDIPLLVEDYRSLGKSWADTVDMVMCLTTSLPHMLTDEDVIRALESMYDRMNDKGILVISNGITDALLDTKPKFIPARINKNDAFYFVCEYQAEATLTFNIVYIKKTEESFDHRFTSTTYNAMRKSVLERCFEKTKFKNIEYYGEYDFSPYTRETSPKLIVIAAK